ncbi:uncharacterized protein LOC121253694 isoform X1 [Juglans microcarpa x Juglans regia]|uniref:uncharacterized protein LOC121253694 isoform X1 n=1 Tax=Juglans microcarpa x Juglans regia TaxID=2249226 RepID=UPI001B7D9C1E|nr:uncharacterized protein LOC121253694 isoform X1 [Juglans microcarpa x Juglans regia]
MADEVRGERGHDYMEKTTLWQELDLSFEEEWKCTGDSVRYKKRLENERVFEFLVGLNQDLDDVRGRILGRRPLPSTREVFSEVRQEENRRKVMLKEIFSTGHIGPEMSALVSWGTLSRSGSRQEKGRPWCEHCRKPRHTKETCWEIHGKSSDWKPSQNNRNCGYQVAVDHQIEQPQGEKSQNPTPTSAFNAEQLEQLYKIFSTLHALGQSSTSASSGSLAHRGPIIGEDDWQC